MTLLPQLSDVATAVTPRAEDDETMSATLTHVQSAITTTCRKCQKPVEIVVNTKDYNDFINQRGHIQDLMPYLTDGEREILISGICEACFDELFAEDEE